MGNLNQIEQGKIVDQILPKIMEELGKDISFNEPSFYSGIGTTVTIRTSDKYIGLVAVNIDGSISLSRYGEPRTKRNIFPSVENFLENLPEMLTKIATS
ncbi:hypothetical protein KC842_02180 [Candidatus Nomurabacteria bacterium]|nr:hypothetical protein [Candidatus Nomurabacteria bacterium]USN94976.1 MAG: hypothetical protein H6791_00920 [Candidatus Nomurabacteria bacterium]